MRNNNISEARRWTDEAESDIVAAEWLASGRFYSKACFLSQQAAEKALKGYLISKGVRDTVGHSTDYLLQRCMRFDKTLKEFGRSCKRLDRHYIPTRYPDGLPEGTPHENYAEEDASEAIEMAKRVAKAVADRM